MANEIGPAKPCFSESIIAHNNSKKFMNQTVASAPMSVDASKSLKVRCGGRTDLAELAVELSGGVRGEVDFTDAARALYTSDASNYRQVPLGVVYPQSKEDIVATVSVCRSSGHPVLMRGAGTSQNGQCVNAAVIVDCSRFMNKVLSIDAENGIADIEPGVVCDQLKLAAAEFGLTFGPDPATHSRCTLGGMIGNNSCGPHSMLAGKTVENVIELDVITSDGVELTLGPTTDADIQRHSLRNDRTGEIYRELKTLVDAHARLIREKYPNIKRRVSGFNLDQLLPENGFNLARALVGTEGTCVSVVGARVQLITDPACKRLLVLGFEDIFQAGDCVGEILPFSPIAMEGLDWAIVGGLIERGRLLEEVALLPRGKAWILTEIAADDEKSLQQSVQQFASAMQSNEHVLECKIIDQAAEVAQLWSIREQGASATALSLDPSQPDPVVGWEDTAVDPLQLGDYLREFHALVARYGYKTSLYGHFGDGCIHARISFDTRTEEGVRQWRSFSNEIARTVVKYGGSLSGEHGDGQAKAEFLPIMYGDELVAAFEKFKTIWDPDSVMNPGKVVKPYRMDENLRLGVDYQTPVIDTVMKFADDAGGLGRSLERCVGMGKCRATTGPMCPTYQASMEERFSTRGRAHLLHELHRGNVIGAGVDDEDVNESLVHCLSCKACKTACPTRVDIAAYKSEYMSQRYQQRKRPLSHSAIGRLGDRLPLMARFVGLLNMAARMPLFGRTVNRVLGFDTKRKLPLLAPVSFRKRLQGLMDELPCQPGENFWWFGRQDGKQVVLWLDSFNCYYKPQVSEAALRVLVQQGFCVGIAKSTFCCGRPLYEYGLLTEAKERLQNILDSFHVHLPVDTDVIVLEPSCLSVFRDELINLHGEKEAAVDLAARTRTLADFLEAHEIYPDKPSGKALLHLHCHHKSLDRAAAEQRYLQRCFETVEEPEQGCCGMAGVFGYQKQTRALSRKIFARNLGPAVEHMPEGLTLVSNGFSCHEQLNDLSAVQSLHVAEVIENKLSLQKNHA